MKNSDEVKDSPVELNWTEVSQPGATFARNFKAQVASGELIAALIDENKRAGLGLTYVRRVSSLNWSGLDQSGGPPSTRLFESYKLGSERLPTVYAYLFEGVEKTGIGLAHCGVGTKPHWPTEVIWSEVTQSGANIADLILKAQVAGGELIAALCDGHRKAGLGLTYVHQASISSINWSEVPHTGAQFAQYFAKAQVNGGELIAAKFEGPEQAGLGLAFIPSASILSLDWTEVPYSGAQFASHFKAEVTGGRLFAAYYKAVKQAGLGITFVPA